MRSTLLLFSQGTEAMRPEFVGQESWPGMGLLSSLLLLLMSVGTEGQEGHAQHIILPPAVVATPLSAEISAQAQAIAAYGDLLESAAIARKINAEAVAVEIQNSVAFVDAYFKRRELNRDWRAKENPNIRIHEQKVQEAIKEDVEKQYQKVMRGDVTKTLNWLLGELSCSTVACQYLPGGRKLIDTEYNQKLTDGDLRMIRVTDGGKAGSRLVFSIGDGSVLENRWPLALQSPEFDAARAQFDHSRDAVIEQLRRQGSVKSDDGKRLLQSVNGLFTTLDGVYPRELRAPPGEFLKYNTAKRYLQTLLAGVHRALTTSDTSVFSGSHRFQGDGLIELVQYMYQSGLEFAPPEPGAEGVYKKLFEDLRAMYVNLGAIQKLARTDGAKDDGGK
jgi:hypothetical protein